MKALLTLGLVFGAVAGAPAISAQAEDYPSQPIRFIVPLGPGSGADTNTRLLADTLQKITGVPSVVENRPGGDTSLGTAAAMNLPADGYTLLQATPSTTVINPLLMKDLSYKPEQIRYVLHLTNNVGVLVTAADSKFTNLKDMLDEARKAPGTVSLGVYGNTYRLGAQQLAKEAGVQFNDIPYKGFGPTINDVIGGTTQTAFVDLGGAFPLIQSGKLRALAVGSDKRLDFAPDIPTVSESGFPGYTLYIFVGYAVRSDTPEPIVQKLEALLQKAVQQPGFQERITEKAGTLFVGHAGKQFTEFVQQEEAKARNTIGPGK